VGKRGRRNKRRKQETEGGESAAPADPSAQPDVAAEAGIAPTPEPESEAADGPPPSGSGSALDDLLDAVAREGLSPREEPPVEAVADVEGLSIHVERAPRVPLEVYVKVVKGERVARAMTRDVSVSGLYLAALTLPVAQPGDAVMVELCLPGSTEPIWAQAEVVRDENVGGFPALALRFSRLTEADTAALSGYVESRLPPAAG
jgi:hypothetical protein